MLVEFDEVFFYVFNEIIKGKYKVNCLYFIMIESKIGSKIYMSFIFILIC